MTPVRTGLESLLEDPGALGLAGARAGLLCHAASVDRRLRHAADLLLDSRDFRLVRLFGPEHGVRGEAQDMEAVSGETDRSTGLPVVSLYGATEDSLRPPPGSLDDLDVVLVDLQDVGSRYYTFVYTIANLMEAAGRAGVRVVVLDRPNPIGGARVEGPVLDPSLASFVGRFAIAVRHGLTCGELATMFRDRFGISCDLSVAPMLGWRRGMHQEDTGLPWVLPSPNMPTPDTARVYPGGCLVEGTNLSEGRGTTRPFELVGAPWLSGRALAEALCGEGLPGVAFRPGSFRPTFQKHAGATCEGIQVHVLDREAFRPFVTYLAVIREARRQDRSSFAWRREPYEFETTRLAIDLLLGRPGLRERIESDAPLDSIEEDWLPGLRAFTEDRRHFLRYPD